MSRMMLMENLGKFLTEIGFIYTVRKYRMTEKDVMVDGVGKCRRMPVKEIVNQNELSSYVAFSGFSTVEEWWKTIGKFIRPNEPKYLYKVTKID